MSLIGRFVPPAPVRRLVRGSWRSTPFPLLLKKVPPALPRPAPSISAHPLSPAAYYRVLRASYSPLLLPLQYGKCTPSTKVCLSAKSGVTSNGRMIYHVSASATGYSGGPL